MFKCGIERERKDKVRMFTTICSSLCVCVCVDRENERERDKLLRKKREGEKLKIDACHLLS